MLAVACRARRCWSSITGAARVAKYHSTTGVQKYYVAIEIKESEHHGRGVFAGEDIKEGSQVWGYSPDDCDAYTEGEMRAMPAEEIKELLWGGYLHEPSNLFVVGNDGNRFTNHSDNPTTAGDFNQKLDENEGTFATR